MVVVRYIVADVGASIAFYRDRLGFNLDMNPAPGFAALSRDGLRLLINQSGFGGAGTAGGQPVPGGWNRFQIETDDLDRMVADCRAAGASFRGEVVQGQGGQQVILEDPSGNPVELFEPRKS
ncbi:VOC family protein [Aquibium sp. LZ166]|uniref:VOC family protein n=2 Tax=Aquibium pacificus TaxID=3153579 RepID=A0ABV3SDM8_9HYPH